MEHPHESERSREIPTEILQDILLRLPAKDVRPCSKGASGLPLWGGRRRRSHTTVASLRLRVQSAHQGIQDVPESGFPSHDTTHGDRRLTT